MKPITIISSLAVIGTFAAAGIFFTPSLAADSTTAPLAERQWLSIPQVHEKLEAAGYRHIEKIEREHGGYEARATDSHGDRIKLYVNPQTGAVMDQRGQGPRVRDGGDGSRRSSGDCTKRRCRDDLPPPATSTPTTR
jgi:hypothetical protein